MKISKIIYSLCAVATVVSLSVYAQPRSNQSQGRSPAPAGGNVGPGINMGPASFNPGLGYQGPINVGTNPVQFQAPGLNMGPASFNPGLGYQGPVNFNRGLFAPSAQSAAFAPTTAPSYTYTAPTEFTPGQNLGPFNGPGAPAAAAAYYYYNSPE